MAASSSSCHHLFLVLRSQPPSPSPSPSTSIISFLKPLFLPSSNALSIPLKQLHRHHPQFRKTLFPSSSLFFSSSSSPTFTHTPPLTAVIGNSPQKPTQDAIEEYNNEDEEEEETDVSENEFEIVRGNSEETQVDSTSSPLERKRGERLKVEVPSLTVKERKELASYAHSLGKKLKTQLVGKSGVTPNLAISFSDTLEANELLKIKIHRSCPGELEDVVKQLEEATNSVAVGQIGRTLIIYRPSLSKMKAEEKKKQVRKLFLEKQRRLKLVYKSKEQVSNVSRRGSSWKAKARGRDSRA